MGPAGVVAQSHVPPLSLASGSSHSLRKTSGRSRDCTGRNPVRIKTITESRCWVPGPCSQTAFAMKTNWGYRGKGTFLGFGPVWSNGGFQRMLFFQLTHGLVIPILPFAWHHLPSLFIPVLLLISRSRNVLLLSGNNTYKNKHKNVQIISFIFLDMLKSKKLPPTFLKSIFYSFQWLCV